MASSRSQHGHTSKGRLAHLWQLPLLVLSLGLFAFAAYLFIDPKPGQTAEQKIEAVRSLLRHDRPEAAIDQLNALLEDRTLPRETEGVIHLLLAEAVDAAQRQKGIDLAANRQQIIFQTETALAQGARPDTAGYRRLGESYESLDQTEPALKAYRKAEAIDPSRALSLKRKVIRLQVNHADPEAAEASLEEYLKDNRLSDGERAWALGERAHLLADDGKFVEARALLGEALRLDNDPTVQGQANFQLGYCLWKLGNPAEAERLLRLAREQLKVRHPADADAAYTLGRIRRERGDPEEAIAFYEAVLTSHPDAEIAPMARLGRGVCRVMLAQDDAGLTDLHDLVNELDAKPARQRFKAEALASLRQAEKLLTDRGNFQGALEVLAYEQTLQPKPAADFFARLAGVFERRADQVEKSATSAPTADEKERRVQESRALRTKAGDAYLAHARALTTDDDKAYGESIWKAADLYDKAGSLPLAVSALELFVAERPSDGLAPDALLRLGRTYFAAAQFDRAIAAFRRNQSRYPQSLAASKSGVPLAQALIAKGPDQAAGAEAALKAVIDDNAMITPEAEEFREGLFELAGLYYRTDRFDEAIVRLDEMASRYPDDRRMGQVLFLTADSYRKSAALLKPITPVPSLAHATVPPATQPAQQPAQQVPAATDRRGGNAAALVPNAAGKARQSTAPSGSGGVNPSLAVQASAQEMTPRSTTPAPLSREAREAEERENARRDRLTRAKKLYDQVIDRYRATPPATELDKLYLKLSHFYRADCLYDLRDYAGAIGSYEFAATRYQDDASSLAAHVQIVNAYCAMGRFDQARAANERAKWLLRRMPAEAFDPGKSGMSKENWEQWLRWTTAAGVFKE